MWKRFTAKCSYSSPCGEVSSLRSVSRRNVYGERSAHDNVTLHQETQATLPFEISESEYVLINKSVHAFETIPARYPASLLLTNALYQKFRYIMREGIGSVSMISPPLSY